MVDLIPTAFSLLFVQRFIVSSCLFAKARVQHSLLYIVISIDPQLMQSCLSSFIGFCGSYLISNIHRSLSYTIRYSYKIPSLVFIVISKQRLACDIDFKLIVSYLGQNSALRSNNMSIAYQD